MNDYYSELKDVASYIRFDFMGCEYEKELDEAIRDEFEKYGIRPVVRGNKANAAGAGLGVDIVISFLSPIASGLILEVLKFAIKKVRALANKELSKSCYVGRIFIETENCDYIITANSAAGVNADDVDINALLKNMEQLKNEEFDHGRRITRIEAPCSVTHRNDVFTVEAVGVGNYSLWMICYSEGEYWPWMMYDSVNNCFFPMDDERRIIDAVNGPDQFYLGSSGASCFR